MVHYPVRSRLLARLPGASREPIDRHLQRGATIRSLSQLARTMQVTNATQTFHLGPDGAALGQIGIGAWAWGDRFFWGYGNQYTSADLRTAFEISINRGVRLFDTAEVYGLGNSEKLLGEFIARAGVRDQVVVATKFFPLPGRFGRGAIVSALHRSLKRLGMAYVDLYQIHWPSPLLPIGTMMDGLADVVEAGMARAVGVSNFDAQQMRQAHDLLAERGVALASNQVEYSLIQRGPETTGLLALCQDLHITLIGYSPLGMGLLTGKYSATNPPPGTRRRRYNNAFLNRLEPLVEQLRRIALERDASPAQVALNWVVAKGAIPIPGVKNARQADDNLGALRWSLTRDEVALLDEASARLHDNA